MLPLRDRMLGSLLGAAVGEHLTGGTAGVAAAIAASESLTGKITDTSPRIDAGEGKPIRYSKPPASARGQSKIQNPKSKIDMTRSQRTRLETPENGSQSVSAAWGVMAALPVALFFHHDRDRCYQQLQQLTVRWQLSPSLAWGLLAVAEAVAGRSLMAQTLAEREFDSDECPLPNPSPRVGRGAKNRIFRLLPRPFLGEGGREGEGIEVTLAESEFGETVRAAIAGRYNLDATLQALGSRDTKQIAVAVAVYCFVDTPEDFFLTVKRSQRSPHPQLSAALAGALSGAYNGAAAVPVTWELAVTERDRLREASDRLYAAWSGVCDLGQAAVWEGTVVGAAGSLRSL